MTKWLGLAVATLVAGAAFAQQPGEADFIACQESVKTNDFDGIIASCEKALAANGDLFLSNYYLGYAYRAQKRYDKCASNFDTFIKKMGSNPDGADMIKNSNKEGGLCYAKASSPTEAIPYLQKAASNKPNDKEVQYYLGTTQMRAKNDEAAERAFAKVIQLDPSMAPPYYFAGRINFNGQQWATATERLQKFLELSPDHQFAADAHFMVGSIAVRNAESSENAEAANQVAITHLEQFLVAKPNAPQSSQAHYILGTLAAQKEDDDGAKSHFEKYLELEPNGAQAEEIKQFLSALSEAESGN
ncbi:MAG: tetratricopeptide repeat protein [Acidobacteria bacterium]|nr:MAG: tetratricopeptide repeat protein [Acidobacteriota bacterium]